MRATLPIPKRIELIFDAAYLISAAAMGVILIASSSPDEAARLWGVMAVTLAVGDAFHLLPRMAAAYTGDTPRFAPAMGTGKLVTSLTMTIFYILLWHCGLVIFSLKFPALTITLYAFAFLRILLCLLPQNGWRRGRGNERFGIYRNIPFALQGILVLWLYTGPGAQVSAVKYMWLAILISFCCYIPVVLWSSRYPKLGMLMLPKTCAYLWIIAMGFGI